MARVHLQRSTLKVRRQRISREVLQQHQARPFLKQVPTTFPYIATVDSRAGSGGEQKFVVKDRFGRYITI